MLVNAVSIPRTSVATGCCGYVESSSSGDPPIKNRLSSGTVPLPRGRQVLIVISWLPVTNK
jgi:hypothetical protein